MIALPVFDDRSFEEGIAMAATIQLLRQCAVRDGGDCEPLRIERQEQALLTYLLIHGKTVVQRERVIEVFWPERPPENGCRCLSTALWRPYRGIAHAAGIRIESSRAGWIRLRVQRCTGK